MSRRNKRTQPGKTVGKGNPARKAADLQGRLIRGQGAASFTNQSLHKDIYNFDQPWGTRDAWLVGDDGQLVKATNYDVWNCTTTADCASGFTCTGGKCVSALDSGTYNHNSVVINNAQLVIGNPSDSCPTSEQPQPPPFDPSDVDDNTTTHTNCRPKRGDTSKSSCVTGTCGDGADVSPDEEDFCDDPACRRDSECPKGSVCRNGGCVPGCGGDSQCPNGFQCDKSYEVTEGAGRCIEEKPCQTDGECGEGQVCSVPENAEPGTPGKCIVNPCPSNFSFSGSKCEPKPCESDSDCGDNEACAGTNADGSKRCVPLPCSGEGDSSTCGDGYSCQTDSSGGSSCVPDKCDGDSDCGEGYSCNGGGNGDSGQCVEDPGTDPDIPPSPNTCNQYCDSSYKSTGEVGSGCAGNVCTECEECVSIRDMYGRNTYHCEASDDPPCTCPAGEEPGLCEKCDEDTGEIVQDTDDCDVCCTAPSIPCSEDCPEGDSDEVKVCVNLASYAASDGGYYVSMAQAAACKLAEQKRKESCEDKGNGCDCSSGMECSQDSHCTGNGFIWAQGSSVAYKLVGKCRDGWSGGVGGTCDVEEVEIPVDPSTGQPTN